MPSSLPSFFLFAVHHPVCLRAVGSFRDGAGVALGGLFPVPSGGLPLKIRQFPLDASDSI